MSKASDSWSFGMPKNSWLDDDGEHFAKLQVADELAPESWTGLILGG